MIKEINLPFV